MFYTAAWCYSTERDFKNAIPFDLLGESIRKYNSTLKFNIVMLEGIENLSSAYIEILKGYGFTIIDYSASFQKIISCYPVINSTYSRYERNCFLRWLAFKDIHKDSNTQFWHLDSDIILHTSLDDLASDTQGKTFTLMGTPAFTTVSDFDWFVIYERELKKLEANLVTYSNQAFSEKNECRGNDLHLANQTHYRNPIGSDQDMLEYLVGSKCIIQSTSKEIFNSKYYYIHNLLELNFWHIPQVEQEQSIFYNKNGSIFIENKKVPFTHFQNTFSSYAEAFFSITTLNLPKSLFFAIVKYKIENEFFKTTSLFKAILRFNYYLRKKSRASIIKKLLDKEGDQLLYIMNFLLKEKL